MDIYGNRYNRINTNTQIRNAMTTENKFIAVTVMMPMVMDMLEDLKQEKVLIHERSKKATNVINAIHRLTNDLFKGIDLDAANEQVGIQNELREMIEKAFGPNDLDETINSPDDWMDEVLP